VLAACHGPTEDRAHRHQGVPDRRRVDALAKEAIDELLEVSTPDV